MKEYILKLHNAVLILAWFIINSLFILKFFIKYIGEFNTMKTYGILKI